MPEGASTDRAAMVAKWGTRAKALFAATPKKVGAGAAPAAAPTRPATPKGTPASPWAEFPQTADGAFQYFCSLLGEPYQGAKHDERWFALFDEAAQGKDPDQFTPEDVLRLFQAIRDGMAK